MSKQTAIEQDGTIVETLPNAMFREAERFSIRLYRVSDIACTVSFNSLLNALEQRSLRHIKELAGFRINFSDWKSIAGITVVSLVQSSDVT